MLKEMSTYVKRNVGTYVEPVSGPVSPDPASLRPDPASRARTQAPKHKTFIFDISFYISFVGCICLAFPTLCLIICVFTHYHTNSENHVCCMC